MHLVKHSAGVVTPNKNGTHFHLYAMIWISVVNAIPSLARSRAQSLLTILFSIRNANGFRLQIYLRRTLCSSLLFGSCEPRLYHFTFEIQQCTYALNLYAHMNVIFCEVSCQYWIQVCMHMKWNGIGRLFFTHKLLCHGIYFHYFSRVTLFFCSLINYFLLLFVAYVPTITNLTNWHWRLV